MKICIVEDNQPLRQNLELLLKGEPGFKVTGAFGNAEDALKFLPRSDTEVLLVDIGLPGMSGVELIKKIKPLKSSLMIIAYTIYEDRDTVFAAIKAGACGYLLKGAPPRELIESLHSLYNGGAHMSPKIARKIIAEIQGGDENALLSSREREILGCISQGRSYKEIGVEINISAHTVHSHIKNIYGKLQAATRSDALK